MGKPDKGNISEECLRKTEKQRAINEERSVKYLQIDTLIFMGRPLQEKNKG